MRSPKIAQNAKFLGAVVLTVVLFGCNTVPWSFNDEEISPRESYIRQLQKSRLNSSPFVKSWIDAGDPTLHDSTLITLPFHESGIFSEKETRTQFYYFSVEEGQVLTLQSSITSQDDAKLFIDIFYRDTSGWQRIDLPDSSNIKHLFTLDCTVRVRLQPELLSNVRYAIAMNLTPVLINPVSGADTNSIRSFYGDSREGGKRKHEGVDIFAPKGTLVVAPTDGTITIVKRNALGGKVVWMNDKKRGHSYYFAHLDSQIVQPGMEVRQGDPLGTVGNTGNARRTPSHLHFGIYQRNSKNPAPFITSPQLSEISPDTTFRSAFCKIKTKKATLLENASRQSPIRQVLTKDSQLKVLAIANDKYYRVLTPDFREGYIEKTKVIVQPNIPAPAVSASRSFSETHLLCESHSSIIQVHRDTNGS